MKTLVLTKSAVEFVVELAERRLIRKSGVTSRDVDDLMELGLIKDQVHKPLELTGAGIELYWDMMAGEVGSKLAAPPTSGQEGEHE